MKLLLAIVAALAFIALLKRWSDAQSGGASGFDSQSQTPQQPGAMGAPQTDGPGTSLADYSPAPVQEMMQAIFQFEGGQPGDVNFDNDNPGNLRSGPGMVGTNRGYAVFSSFTDGWAALQDWITSHAAAHPDWDFYDMMNVYSPDGNGDNYANYIANYLGVPATAPVSSVIG